MRFRLVDRILSWESRQRIVGLKTASYAECALRESMGESLHLPESLLTESFFQLGNWLIALSSGFTAMGLIVRTRRIEFRRPVLPGDVVRIDLAVQRFREDGVLLNGAGSVDGQEVCSGSSCIAALVPLADYVDPEELRRLYRDLYRPETPQPGR